MSWHTSIPKGEKTFEACIVISIFTVVFEVSEVGTVLSASQIPQK